MDCRSGSSLNTLGRHSCYGEYNIKYILNIFQVILCYKLSDFIPFEYFSNVRPMLAHCVLLTYSQRVRESASEHMHCC